MLREKFDLNGKIALVTGAGRGIGIAYAKALAEFGANLAIADINLDSAKETSELLKKEFNIDSISLYVDISKSNLVINMLEDIMKHFGKIDIAINNAGNGNLASAENITDKMLDDVVDVNFKGTFLCCREEAKIMIKNGGGSIINIASQSGVVVNRPQRHAHYSAAKAAIIFMTKCLASDWAEYNIRVNCISPGYTLTQMTTRDEIKNLMEIWKNNHIPMKRMATVEDLMGAALFLATDASSFVTGHNLIVDGGCTIW